MTWQREEAKAWFSSQSLVQPSEGASKWASGKPRETFGQNPWRAPDNLQEATSKCLSRVATETWSEKKRGALRSWCWFAERECKWCWYQEWRRPAESSTPSVLTGEQEEERYPRKHQRSEDCRNEGSGSSVESSRWKWARYYWSWSHAQVTENTQRSPHGVWTTQRSGVTVLLVLNPVPQFSSLPRLHVGRNRSPSSQALKALVGVVNEDPVLVLQVGLHLVGNRSNCRKRRKVLVVTNIRTRT